mgnify:CR=1 FL=1
MPEIFASTNDGNQSSALSATWNAAHDHVGQSNPITTHTAYNFSVGANYISFRNQYFIRRSFFDFDTSGISVTPASAELSLYGFTNGGADLFVVKADFSDGSIGNGDFDSIVGWSSGADNSSNVTKYSSEVTSCSTGAYNNITLNSTALSDMANNDTLKICLIEADFDLTNTEPSDTTARETGMSFADDGSGNIRDPKIDYTVASAGYGHDVVGVAAANIGKIKGVATANVGKVLGVD